jgi:hypothetical protein
MATTTLNRLTKPRISALILEATTAFVALVLVLWLLLWFIRMTQKALQIETFFIASKSPDAPFHAADVRALRGLEPSDGVASTSSADLLNSARDVVKRSGSPVVLYISAPALGTGADAQIGELSVRELIQDLSANAQREVLLALDLAQIDTDRDLGVFGNAPYSGLDEFLASLPAPSHSFFILTSTAPAQKSWVAEGLGRSAFAYFLAKGLQGDAVAWDGTRQGITVQGLHRYVMRHVNQWAQVHRGAVQTPMLLALPNARSFAMPAIAKSSGPLTAAKEKEKGSPAEPVVHPREEKLRSVLAEWQEHDKLRARRPYAHLPASWRSYQAALMRAQQFLRAGWRDAEDPALESAVLQPTLDALKLAVDKRNALVSDLAQEDQEETRFPFRPAEDEGGRRSLNDILEHLTGLGNVAPNPAAPAWLAQVPVGGHPQPYLEMQLPVWAAQFIEHFQQRDYFKRNLRGEVLHKLVELRRLEERAIARDRRGLAWIASVIRLGDNGRRLAQDRLFGLPADAQIGRIQKEIAEVQGISQSTLDLIEAYRAARETWEQISAELPDVAEWAIRIEASAWTGSEMRLGEVLTRDVSKVLDELPRLVATLEREIPADESPEDGNRLAPQRLTDLSTVNDNVRHAWEGLEKRFSQRVGSLATDVQGNWGVLDAALRSPALPADKRGAILRRILSSSETIASLQPDPWGATNESPQAAPSPDRGFWVRAGGLAALDLELRRLSQDRLKTEAKQTREQEVDPVWGEIRPVHLQPEVTTRALERFARISNAVGKLRGARQLAADEPAGLRDLREVEKELRLADRAARLLTSREIDDQGPQAIDLSVRKLDLLTRYSSLLFQRERLKGDFVRFIDQAVNLQLQSAEQTLGLNGDPGALPSSNGLKLEVKAGENEVKPGESLKIDPATEECRLDVSLVLSGGGLQRAVLFPEGQAFVGYVNHSPEGLTIQGEPPLEAGVPGFLTRVPSTPQDPAKAFRFGQKELKNKAAKFEVDIKCFYRGRVDEAGTTRLSVIPTNFAQLITVKIEQNRDVLREKYKGRAEFIKDQFEEHPADGYMHKGKDLAYVLTIENLTPRKLSLRYQRQLIDPSGAAPAVNVDRKFEEVVLEPRGKGGWGSRKSISGVITSNDVDIGKPKVLRLTVNGVDGKPMIDPFDVEFHQITCKDYIDIKPYTTDAIEHEGVVQPCFVVEYSRRRTDGVTEPILGSELSCTIEGKTKRGTDENLTLERGGPTVLTTYPWRKGIDMQFKWSGRIENEDLPETVYSVRP